MPDISNYRRRYVINKIFQFKIIINLASLVVFTVILANGFALMVSGWLPKSAPEPIPTSLYGIFHRTVSGDVLWISAIFTVIAGILLVLVLGLLRTHRIAGPLFNLKRLMGRVGGGDLTPVMSIRVKDEFHDLEEAFNQMLDGLNGKINTIQEAVQTLPEPQREQLQKVLEASFRCPGGKKNYVNL